ncbi:MAG: hypothetical protein AB7J13_00830 [Pyrinomonadaceae bacterium]
MKRTLTIASVLLSVAGLLQLSAMNATAQAGRGGKPNAAVLFYDNTGKAPRSLSELDASIRWLTIVPSSIVQRKLQSEKVQLSGDVDPSTAVRIGKLLGVNYLILNRVVDIREVQPTSSNRSLQVELATSLIDTSTGYILWADEARFSGTALCVCDLGDLHGVIARAGFKANMSIISELPSSVRLALGK